MILGPQMADISVKNQRANLNTGQYNIFKIQKYTYETLNDAVRQPVSTPWICTVNKTKKNVLITGAKSFGHFDVTNYVDRPS